VQTGGEMSQILDFTIGSDVHADSCAWPRDITAAPAMAPQDTGSPVWDMVDEWGAQSFPASDPPANW
jgi:hypothetical protein